MGIIKNGPYGTVYGKVGNLVTYRLLNKDVTRIVGENKKAPSVKQLACRLEMALVIGLLKPVVEFVNVGFMLEAAKMDLYAHNVAVSYNKQHALAGDYPEVSVDYTKVRVAQGVLPMAVNPQVSLVDNGLRFSWDAGPYMDFAERRHRVMMLAYFPSLGSAAYCIGGAERIAGADTLYMSAELYSVYMETYLSFVELGSNEVANSVYLGALNIG